MGSDTSSYSEECKESHPKCSEVSMLTQTLTWILFITAETSKHLNPKGRENKEQEKEEQAWKCDHFGKDMYLPFYLDFQLVAVPASLCSEGT